MVSYFKFTPLFGLEIDRKQEIIAILTVSTLAIALRLYMLGEWSFWIEEHHSIRSAADFEWSLSSIASNVRPLYFMLLVPSLNVLGINEWSARLVSALIGALTIPFIYYVTRKIQFNRTIAFTAALIGAISPWHIYWSQNARFYTLLLLLGAASTWVFFYGIETNKQRYIYLSLVFLGLAALTHSIAAVLVPVYIMYLILLRLPYWKTPPGANVRNVLPFIVLPLLGYVSLELVRRFLFQEALIVEIIYTKFFNEATASYIGYGNPIIMITSFVYYIGTPVAFFTIIGAWVLIRAKNRAGLMLILSAFLPLGLVTILTLFASTANRYAFLCIVSWFILGSVGFYEVVSSVKNKQRSLLWFMPLLLVLLWRDPAIKDVIYHFQEQPVFRVIVLATPAILALTFFYHYRSYLYENLHAVAALVAITILFAHPILMNVMYFQYQDGHRGNMKAVSSLINRESQENDVVVSSVKPLAAYYVEANVKDLNDFELVLIGQDGNTIWFIEDYGVEQIDVDGQIITWLEVNCVSRQHFDHFVAGYNWKLRVHQCQ